MILCVELGRYTLLGEYFLVQHVVQNGSEFHDWDASVSVIMLHD